MMTGRPLQHREKGELGLPYSRLMQSTFAMLALRCVGVSLAGRMDKMSKLDTWSRVLEPWVYPKMDDLYRKKPSING